MKTLIRAAALVASLAVLPAQAEEGVEVRLTALASGKLDLRYTLPPGCHVLPLRDGPWPLRVAQELRSQWLAMDDCGALDGLNVVRHRAACSTVRFQVPARALMIDRVSPPVYPVGEQGLYVHTGSFAPTSDCGAVTWKLVTSGGSVVVSGSARGAEFTAAQAAMPELRFAPVYFSLRPLPATDGAIVVFDPAVPGWAQSGLQDASDGILPHYRKTFAQMAVPAPSLVATHVADNGPTRLQADAGDPRMVRMALYNFGAERDTEQLMRARGTLAHEYAHTLQTGLRTDAFRHPERTLLLEGGAEFIRWMSEYRLGWKSGAALGAELSDALNFCLMEAGDLPWKRVMTRNAGRTPYHCGLAFHVLALAGRQSPEPADAVLGSYYAAVRRDPTLDFAKAMECGATAGCQPAFLNDLFRSNAGVASQVADRLRALNISVKTEVQPSPQVKGYYAAMAFAQLMTEDCNGKGFWTRADHFEVDRIESCHTLQRGMKIAKAEGIGFFSEPLQAAQALADACEKKGAVTLGLAEGGEVSVSCRHPYRPATQFYKIDSGRVFTLLDARQAG